MSTIEAGLTQERLKQADGHVSVGGENKQRRYTFRDEVLTRTYEPLIRSAKTDRRRTRSSQGTLMTGGGRSILAPWGCWTAWGVAR